MRTIKFRGKRLDDGEWVYGSYISPENALSEQHVILNSKDPQFHVDGSTVGMFTGRRDRTEREAYDGDILLSNGMKAQIHYSVNHFCWFWGSDKLTNADLIRGRIVGTVHDQPTDLERFTREQMVENLGPDVGDITGD
jgi:hypothetical protein